MALFYTLFLFFVTAFNKEIFDFLQDKAKNITEGLADKVLFCEHSLNALGVNNINAVMDLSLRLGISLIVLKFLYKGFCIYIIGTEGDGTNSPETLFVNFVKAIFVATSFPVLYGWLATITKNIVGDVSQAIALQQVILDKTFIDTLLAPAVDLWQATLVLIWLIIFVIFYIQVIIRGMEMLVLRMGFPLVCHGIMDSDGGVFSAYAKKFYQTAATIITQLMLCQLSFSLLSGGDPFWGIAALIMALKTPTFLNEFMLTAGHSNIGGGVRTMASARVLLRGIRKSG